MLPSKPKSKAEQVEELVDDLKVHRPHQPIAVLPADWSVVNRPAGELAETYELNSHGGECALILHVRQGNISKTWSGGLYVRATLTRREAVVMDDYSSVSIDGASTRESLIEALETAACIAGWAKRST